MKHFRLTAEEVIGWLRIVRPGSIIGPQQQFMKEMQGKMWRDGELMRARLQQPTLTTAVDEESDGNKIGALVSPSSIASRFSSNNITATATNNVTTPTGIAAHTHGSSPSTPNSLARRLNRVTIGTTASPSTTTSPSTTAAAINASSGKAEREGRETQGDLLRMRRAQAMMSAHSSPTTLSVSSPAGNTRSSVPSSSVHTSPTSSRTYGNSLTPNSTSSLRPNSRSGSATKPTAAAAGTRSSFGNFLGFGNK